MAFIISLFEMNNLAHAQENNRDKNTSKSVWSVEIDPLVFTAFKGVGGHVMWKPKASKHFLFGLAAVTSLEMPKAMLNMDSKNKNQGWHYRVNQGFGLETEYYFEEVNKDWFVGLQLFTQEINLTNDNVPSVKEHRTNTGMAVATVGYKWYPLHKKGVNLYLKPWAGAGYSGVIHGAIESEIIDNTKVGDRQYHINPFVMFASVHLGYTF